MREWRELSAGRLLAIRREVLRETEDSVLEIAGALGYGNGSKFAKAFREVMGTSPAAYRRQSQET